MTRASGVPLLVGALVAIDCEVEDIVERHSHAIVIGRAREIKLSSRTAALAYWQGQYVAIDQSEDAIRLAEVSPSGRARSQKLDEQKLTWGPLSALNRTSATSRRARAWLRVCAQEGCSGFGDAVQ
jgi:hypothetical protein